MFKLKNILKNILNKLISLMLCACLSLTSTLAYGYNPNNDIVVDSNADAAYQPTLKSSTNNTDVIDITAPTSSGVSINHYDSLNNSQGLIFNNSQYDGTSQIGGFVEANVNMNKAGDSAASLILNQVNGTSRSRFSAPSEVFGAAAELLISNQNGVTCSGCSFIGVPKLTLTTGNPTYNNQDWSRELDVDQGDVEIEGLSGEGLQYVDIISRSAAIIGELTAQNEVNIIAGRNIYDYDNGAYVKKEDDGSAKPELAIDAAVFGSISAGRIRLIANENGVGVRSLANLTSNADDIIISADGQVTVSNLNAAGDITITSHSSNINAGNMQSARNTQITAQADIAIDEQISSGQDIELTSNNNNININANLDSNRDITANAANNITNIANLKAEYNINITANNSFTNKGDLAAANNLNIAANNIESTTALQAGNDLIMSIFTNSISIANSLSATRDVIINIIGDYSNNILIQAGRNLIMTVSNLLTNNSTSRLHADNHLHLTANSIDNQGLIDSGANLRLKASTSDVNTVGIKNTGLLYAGADMSLWTAAQILNTAVIDETKLQFIADDQSRTYYGHYRESATEYGPFYHPIAPITYDHEDIVQSAVKRFAKIYSNANMYLGDIDIDQNIALDLGNDIEDIAQLQVMNKLQNIASSIESNQDINVNATNLYNQMLYFIKDDKGYNSTESGASHLVIWHDRKATDIVADITAGNDINLTVNNIYNQGSIIKAVNDINITADILENNQVNRYRKKHPCNDHSNWGACDGFVLSWASKDYTATFTRPIIHAGGLVDIDTGSQTNSGTISGDQSVTISAAEDILNQGKEPITNLETTIDTSSFLPRIDGVVVRINVEDNKDIVNPSYSFYMVSTIYEFDPARYATQSRVIDAIRQATGADNKEFIDDCLAQGNSAQECIDANDTAQDNSKPITGSPVTVIIAWMFLSITIYLVIFQYISSDINIIDCLNDATLVIYIINS